MALAAPQVHDRKRVKVYELKSNDWFDRGTGFCTGTLMNDEARIHVQSEDEPDRTLLETRITKEDGYQKQQDTLIVWTDQNVTDMALSFQEAEGCAAIWEFVSDAQQKLGMLGGGEDGLPDEIIDTAQVLSLPDPELGNIGDIEGTIRMANTTGAGREALVKFVVTTDYIPKLAPLVDMAEDLESLVDLHRLCNIMKTLILLNDNAIIEQVVKDDVFLGVIGALEYDPEFPNHKANHRLYLSDESRFKEVVKIEDPHVQLKIHWTYRLQYLKDVVLARILDDPTYSVLNSLIFFNQVDIVQHVQASPALIKELFSIFSTQEQDGRRKKDAVIFIQQCCAIAKGLQPNGRSGLFANFITAGLFHVITFALKHPDAAVRVAGTDILVAVIDHDPLMMRSQIFKAINEKSKPLTDTLIELLLVEVDLGVKAQMADAIKVLLDPHANSQSMEAMGRVNGEYMAKMRTPGMMGQATDQFVQVFYDESAKKLFKPLKDLEGRDSMEDLTLQEISLYSHLVEVLCFFVRQHAFRSKFFLLAEGLASRVAQLMACPEKHLKLTALKYFRTCLGLHDPFHHRQMTQNRLLEPILDIVHETMPKDNLLNSACLDFFEFIKRENLKELTIHLVENYREKLEEITYVDTFRQLIDKYEQYIAPPPDNLSFTTVETEQTPNRSIINGGQRWQGLRDTDAEEEAYFNGSDNEEGDQFSPAVIKSMANGASPLKPLVDYPEDDDENMDLLNNEGPSPDLPQETIEEEQTSSQPAQREQTPPPPERLSEKRRREEDEEDELGKLSSHSKRRSSVSSTGTAGSTNSQVIRRKKSMSSGKDGPPKKISISLAVKQGKAEAEEE